MFNGNYKLTLYSLFIFISLMLGMELILRMAGFEFHSPSFQPPSPPCIVLGSCNNENRGLFETKGAEIALRPEYYGWFQEQSFPAQKPADEFRVFILGGSTIYNLYGQMESSYRDSGRAVRIVNIGGNSFGTARLFPVFDEILGYDPDLLLIYSGHNEFADIAVTNIAGSTSPFRQKIREILRPSRVCGLIEMAIYRAGMNFMRIKKRHDNGVVRYFATRLRSGTDKNKVYGLYREYLAAMVHKARARSIMIRLSTVSYNRVIAPVVPDAARAMHQKGMELMRERKYKEALAMLNKAQDAEEVPFGANETSNGIVRDVAGEYKVPLSDVDAAVTALAPHGIPGNEAFFDQCHFSDSRFLGLLFKKEIRGAIAELKKTKAAKPRSKV